MQVTTSVGAQYDIAVEKKIQDSVKEQGQQALKLIEAAAAAAPSLASSGDVGTQLHAVG